jgi:hypothetical protein
MFGQLDASRGTLVAWKKPFSTLSVTSVPPPGRDPRHVFQSVQEVPEDETSAQAPPAEESPKDEQPSPKKIRTEGWGNLFPTATPGWKCERCLITNNPEDDKCKACEAPRLGTGTASVVGGSAAGGNNGSGGAAVSSAAASGGSIGTGVFRFGVGEETMESIEESKGGFKFGITEGGFSFGKMDKSLSETPKPTEFSFPKTKGTTEDVFKPESEKENAPESPAHFSSEIKPPAKSEHEPPKFSFGVTPKLDFINNAITSLQEDQARALANKDTTLHHQISMQLQQLQNKKFEVIMHDVNKDGSSPNSHV